MGRIDGKHIFISTSDCFIDDNFNEEIFDKDGKERNIQTKIWRNQMNWI